MGGRFSFFFFVYFNLKNWMKLVVFRNRRESDYVTFVTLCTILITKHPFTPCDLLRMIKCHLGSEGCKAESAVVNEPRHPSQLLPRLCSLARNKSHSRRYAVDCYSFGGKKFLYYYHCEQIAFFLIISTLIYPSNVSSCSYI